MLHRTFQIVEKKCKKSFEKPLKPALYWPCLHNNNNNCRQVLTFADAGLKHDFRQHQQDCTKAPADYKNWKNSNKPGSTL